MSSEELKVGVNLRHGRLGGFAGGWLLNEELSPAIIDNVLKALSQPDHKWRTVTGVSRLI